MKSIHINKTVTKNFFVDILSSIQNLFGMNMTSYEKMVDKAMRQINEELGDIKLEWYRYEISQLGAGALSVTLYGEVQQ